MLFSRISQSKIFPAVVATFLGVLVVGLAAKLPVALEERVVISPQKADGVIEIQENTTVSQSIVLAPGTYSGLKLFTSLEQLPEQPIIVAVYDTDGQLVSENYARNTVYAPEYNESLKIEFPFSQFTVDERTRYRIDLTMGDSALPLLASTGERDIYQQGAYIRNSETTNQDVAVVMNIKTPLSFGAQQGVLAGVIFVIGLSLITTVVPSRWQWMAATLLLIGITPIALAGYWFSDDVLGIADWDYYFSLHNAYRETILTHHTFPFWNPWTCGGTAGLGDPEFPVFMPTFWVELMFGVETGIPLAIYLSTAVGAVGFLLLGKRLGMSVLAAVVVSVIAMFGTVNLLEITEGHVNVFAAMWIPWIFWSWLGVYRKQTSPIICGIFLALIFYQGGIYLLMYTGLAFITLILFVRRRLDALRGTVIAGVWALGFAAIKLIPVLMWLRQFPDDAYASSTFTLPYITDILFGRHLHGTYLIFRQDSGWHEYGAYIGYIAFGLALAGLTYIRKSRIIFVLAISAALSVLVSSLGPQLESTFDLLWFFPRSNISRFILFAVVSLALLAGFGLDMVRSKFKWGNIFALILIGAVAIDLMSLTYQVSQQAFVLPELYPAPEAAPAPIAFTPRRFDLAGEGSRTSRAYAAARKGWGTFAYCSVLGPDPTVRTVFDENHGAFILNTQNTEAEVTHWSPNEVRVTIDASESFEGSLNTNSVEGWKVNGNEAEIVDGRVGVKLPAGHHELVFTYESPGFRYGIFIFVVTIGVAVQLYWPRKKDSPVQRS